MIPIPDLYLLGILNSRAVHTFLRLTASQIRGGYIEFRGVTLGRTPIPATREGLAERISEVAKRCLEARDQLDEPIHDLEEELNALVYEAYGLDGDDVLVLEQYLNGEL